MENFPGAGDLKRDGFLRLSGLTIAILVIFSGMSGIGDGWTKIHMFPIGTWEFHPAS